MGGGRRRIAADPQRVAEWTFSLSVESWGENPPDSIDIYTIDADGNPSGTYTLYFT